MELILLFFLSLAAPLADGEVPTTPRITRTNVDLNSYCGPNCLTIFLKLKGKDASLAEVTRLAEKGPMGTSLLGLQKAARAKGLFAEGADVSSLKVLRKIGYPAIALTRRKLDTEYNHYQLILGFDGQRVMVVDPPLKPKILPVKQMERLFEGKVLLLSEQPIVLPKSHHYLGIPFLVIGTTGFVLWRILAGKNHKPRIDS